MGDISILIPTKNRPKFLVRLLNYYAEVGMEFPILIADSSGEQQAEETKKAILRLASKLNVFCFSTPDLDVSRGIEYLNQRIKTPYATLVGDDDFLIPNGLKNCKAFLEQHPDYAAAHGIGSIFSVDTDGPFGIIQAAGHYRQPEIHDDRALARVIKYLRNYSVSLFSVHRADVWRKMWEETETLSDKSFAAELLPGCLSPLYGKIKKLDCLYLFRQTHSKRQYIMLKNADWLVHPAWDSSCQVFINKLSEEVSQIDGISIDRAKKLITSAFNVYIKAGIGKRNDYLGLKKIIGLGNAIVSRFLGKISLPNLMNPNAAFYSDFLPIYLAVADKRNRNG